SARHRHGGRDRGAPQADGHRAGGAALCDPRLLEQCGQRREHDLQHPQGLDWAASKGVRVINMSFAGPRDPSMERALKNAHDKGIVLIAAAGNAGPKSPPLYPGADPSVIAVTATDANDKIFSGANRGRYIAVAAPGVDILVPAPEDTYQLTTGTSVSSAEVSGIVALLLERNPNLTPEDIRKILTTSAKHPGTKERDDDFGSGLVDPSKAIQDAGELKAVGQPAKR
ncbi:MAG TPA: S8 family serine peptidase, partial [Dongiaceae bacterium]